MKTACAPVTELHTVDCRRSMMNDSMGYSSHLHGGCLFTYCLILVRTCLCTFSGSQDIDIWLLWHGVTSHTDTNLSMCLQWYHCCYVLLH